MTPRIHKLYRPISEFAFLAILAAYSKMFFFSGWIPHDEGLLGQSAERVLAGQVPHLDFEDAYSGGLSYLHAGAFRLLGISVSSLRMLHWLVACLTMILGYLYVKKSSTPGRIFPAVIAAAGFTILGPLNYPAPMPSWYILYLSLIAVFLLGAALRSAQAELLSLGAGLILGICPWIKVTGIYPIVGLMVLFLTSTLANRSKTLSSATALLPSLTCALLFGRRVSPEFLLWVWLPVFGFGMALVRAVQQETLPKFDTRKIVLFSVGVATSAVTVLALMIARTGPGPLLDGLFLLPQKRLEFAFMPPPPLWPALFGSVLIFGLIAAGSHIAGRIRHGSLIFFAIYAAVTALCGSNPIIYPLFWASLRLLPIVVVIASIIWADRIKSDTWLALAISSWLSLSQFPYAHGIYLLYTMPAIWLAAVSMRISLPDFHRRALEFALAACAMFGALWLNFGNWRSFGWTYLPREQGRVVTVERIGISLPEEEANFWEGFMSRIEKVDQKKGQIIAFPDSPEIPFISSRRSPTRNFYDFMSNRTSQGSYDHYAELAQKARVETIVLNLSPEFSRPPRKEEFETMRMRFPLVEQFGHYLLMSRPQEKRP